MKKLFVLFSALLIIVNSFGNTPIKIDDQILQTFAVQFPHAQKVVWQESNESYIVSFVEDGIRVRIVYLRNGNVTHFLRYYLEENLPLDIRLDVKKKFPGKDIYGIVEENLVSNIENRSKTAYFIKLQDENSWLTIKAERHRKPRVVEKLNKAT
jgi:hypothetical protein